MRDMQDVKPLCDCKECGGEIYDHDRVFITPNGLIHAGCRTSRIMRVGLDFDMLEYPAWRVAKIALVKGIQK